MPRTETAPTTPTDDHPTPHHPSADVPLARLVEAARSGCPGAWRAVVDRYDDGLHAIARGYGCDAAVVRSSADLAIVGEWLAGPRERPLLLDAKVTSDGPSWWLAEAFRGH